MTTKLDKKIRVLNTRPKAQADKLKQYLSSYPNYQSISLPLLDIAPIDVKLWQAQCQVAKPDIIIFISANAVHHSIQYLKTKWQQRPKIAAIGPATNSALKKYNINADIIAKESNSTSLLNNLYFQSIANKTFMIIKGQGGRKLLQEYIINKQAKLIEIDVYQRKCPVDLTAKITKIWRQPIDIIFFYSIESMTNLLNNAPSDINLIIKNTLCLVKSKRIQQQAIKYGIKKIKVFSN